MTKSPLLALAAPISRKTSCSWWKERRSSTTRKDEHPTATSLQVFGIREQLDAQQARDETTDMRPDRHPALRAGDRAHRPEQEPQQDPVAEAHLGGQRYRRNDKAPRVECLPAHPRRG